MQLSKDQINEINSGDNLKPSPKLLNYLKRHIKTYEVNFEWMTAPIKMVVINEKSYSLAENKKYLTNKIFDYLSDEWTHLGVPTIRKTIKYFLDGIK